MHCITSAILIWLAIQTCLGIGNQRQKATSCAEQHTCMLEPRQHSLCGGVNSSLWLVLGREGAQGAHPPAPGPDSGVWLILPLESKGMAGPFTSATLKFVRRTVWGQSGLREKPLEREEAMLGHGAYHENSGSACQQLLIDRKDGQWGGSSCQGIHFTSSGTGFYTW